MSGKEVLKEARRCYASLLAYILEEKVGETRDWPQSATMVYKDPNRHPLMIDLEKQFHPRVVRAIREDNSNKAAFFEFINVDEISKIRINTIEKKVTQGMKTDIIVRLKESNLQDDFEYLDHATGVFYEEQKQAKN